MAKIEETVTKIIDKIAKKQNIETYDLDIKLVSTESENFLSVPLLVAIYPPEAADVNLFAKIAILSDTHRGKVPVTSIYETEISAYTNLLASYKLLQEKYRVPKEERYKSARYYASSLVENEEVIVIEDLTAQGYAMYNRSKTVNFEYAQKAVEELAKFHALSIVYKNQFPHDYSRESRQAEQSKVLDSIYEPLKESYLDLVQYGLDAVSSDLRERLEEFINKQWEKEIFYKYYGPSKWGFIVHGDYRASNILFKRQAGKVKHLIPVDYQAIHLGSPVIDLIHFIYSGTDTEFRKVYLKLLLDCYYNSFSKFLRYFKLDSEEIFSRNEFDEEFQDKQAYGLFVSLSVIPVLVAESKYGPDAQVKDGTTLTPKPEDSFEKRILPVIEEFNNLEII